MNLQPTDYEFKQAGAWRYASHHFVQLIEFQRPMTGFKCGRTVEMLKYEHVHFRPWVGDGYPTGDIFGLKVMALGESHYVWEDTPPPCDETERITEWVASSKEPKRFATNVEIALLGTKQIGQDRRRFWDSILFYNYVQTALEGPRCRPTPEMWKAAKPAFSEVLRLHRPDFILVLGQALWNQIAEEGRPGPTIHVDAKKHGVRFFPTDSGREALAMGIRHPSSAFNGRQWHPLVEQLNSAWSKRVSPASLPQPETEYGGQWRSKKLGRAPGFRRNAR